MIADPVSGTGIESMSDSADVARVVADVDIKSLKLLVDQLFNRIAYGLRKEDIASFPLTDEEKEDFQIPSGLRVWRWEAKDLQLFPQKSTGAAARIQLRDLMLERRSKREEGREELLALVNALEDDEKRELIGLTKSEKDPHVREKKEKVKKEGDMAADDSEDKKRARKPKEEVSSTTPISEY